MKIFRGWCSLAQALADAGGGALVVATLASYLLGFALGSRLLLPVLNTTPAYAVLFTLLRRGERGKALKLMLVWAGSLIVFGTLLCATFPERAEEIVLNGPRYRDTMLCWVETGEGEESHPARFLPVHALHLAAYLPIALATGGAGSMLMGGVLTNYMDFFVASLALRSSRPWFSGLLGWFPWSLLRVTGYVILGVVAAEPLLLRGRHAPPGRGRLIVIAALFLTGDVLVKSLAAPSWGRMLSSRLVTKSCAAPML